MTTNDFDRHRGARAPAWNRTVTGARLTSPPLRALRDYWFGVRGDRSMPSRADIDPLDIPRVLGWTG